VNTFNWLVSLQRLYAGSRVRIPLRAWVVLPWPVCAVLFRVGAGRAASSPLVQGILPFVGKLVRKPSNGGQDPHRAVEPMMSEWCI
jgi:hypothetical protein